MREINDVYLALVVFMIFAETYLNIVWSFVKSFLLDWKNLQPSNLQYCYILKLLGWGCFFLFVSVLCIIDGLF